MPDQEPLLANLTPAVVDRELRKLGDAQLEWEEATAAMAAELNEVKTRHEARIRDKKRRLDEIGARLEASCRQDRATLFPGEAQTLKLGFGTVSVRQKPCRVAPREGVSEDDVLRMMRGARNMRGFYDVAYRLNKTELNKAATAGLLDKDALDGLGLEVLPGEESWTIKPDQDAVRKAIGQA